VRTRSVSLVAVLVTSLALFATTASASADLVVNGGFEEGCTAEFCTPKPPWTQPYYGVDVVEKSFVAHHSGNYSVDLNSYRPGGVIQNLATTAGHQYTVSYWMAGNPGPSRRVV
jgi:hypothetical protein